MNLEQAIQLLHSYRNVGRDLDDLRNTVPTIRQLHAAGVQCHLAIEQAIDVIKKHHGLEGPKCPDCGQTIRHSSGMYGDYVICSNADCKYARKGH